MHYLLASTVFMESEMTQRKMKLLAEAAHATEVRRYLGDYKGQIRDVIEVQFPHLTAICGHAFSSTRNIVLLFQILMVAEQTDSSVRDVEDSILAFFQDDDLIVRSAHKKEEDGYDWISLETATTEALESVLDVYLEVFREHR